MKILVIDDESGIREMIFKMLSSEGYELLSATNGIQGIKIIKDEQDINLVITDIIMPEKEGIETIFELKHSFPEIKIIAISGGGRIGAESYLYTAKELGADLTLRKPFVKQDLVDAVHKLLE